ncbi:MAG: DUF507 family protein [Deltaproteobacteria bacterium]|nr:DUF507 family protein [Deltaproteobacteria bacterium]
MISDEKMSHIVHLLMNGLEKEGFVSFPNKEIAVREAHKISNLYLGNLKGAADAARQRILSQKKAPVEKSPQWDILYQKYLEEELQKRGG